MTRLLRLDPQERLQPVHWRPAFDLYRTSEGWLVKVELAGVRSEEVDIAVQGRRITVSGERRDAPPESWQECHALEIAYSRFERTIELPSAVERTHTVTHYRDGMLLVRVITEESP